MIVLVTLVAGGTAWRFTSAQPEDIDDYLGCNSFGRPKLLVAHAVKGKGISYMENSSIFHSRLPNEEEIKIAREELYEKDVR